MGADASLAKAIRVTDMNKTIAVFFGLLSVSSVVPGQEARRDLYGDPLPVGAVARMGTVRFRCFKGAGSIAFSSDGKILASCGFYSPIRLWEASTGRELRRL